MKKKLKEKEKGARYCGPFVDRFRDMTKNVLSCLAMFSYVIRYL